MSSAAPGGASAGANKWTPLGARRRKVTIQTQSAGSRTGMGFLPGTWSTVLTTWAKVTVRQLFSYATVSGQEPIGKAVFILNIRYPPSIRILIGMRVSDGAASYLIQNVQDVDELHREINLFCSEIPAPAAQEQ